MSYTILKTTEVNGFKFTLTKNSELSYFSPSGKARLKMKISYSIALDVDSDAIVPSEIQSKQRFWLTSKSEATKYFNQLKKRS